MWEKTKFWFKIKLQKKHKEASKLSNYALKNWDNERTRNITKEKQKKFRFHLEKI